MNLVPLGICTTAGCNLCVNPTLTDNYAAE
uniref:Uncharacterized protein n=1 Tax=Myoviridae sp. ctCo31 TaxID=2825053 RepID=A0A8S5UME4_9CAUD|nr:MAG TPA: hypothetical protein [Myoviridae sp. ctCo31]